jgi:hypothetical protein
VGSNPALSGSRLQVTRRLPEPSRETEKLTIWIHPTPAVTWNLSLGAAVFCLVPTSDFLTSSFCHSPSRRIPFHQKAVSSSFDPPFPSIVASGIVGSFTISSISSITVECDGLENLCFVFQNSLCTFLASRIGLEVY